MNDAKRAQVDLDAISGGAFRELFYLVSKAYDEHAYVGARLMSDGGSQKSAALFSSLLS